MNGGSAKIKSESPVNALKALSMTYFPSPDESFSVWAEVVHWSVFFFRIILTVESKKAFSAKNALLADEESSNKSRVKVWQSIELAFEKNRSDANGEPENKK